MSETPGVGTPTPSSPTPSSQTPGPDHLAAGAPVLTPGKAFWRTALQVGPSSVISLVVILPWVIQQIVDGFGQSLPENFRVEMLGVAAFLTTLASVTARVMANPAVIAWTRAYAPFFAPPQK